MAARFPEFYLDPARTRDAAEYDRAINAELDRFPAIAAAYLARAAALPGQLTAAIAQFQNTFPDSGALPPTYLLHSLGEMDGGTRDFGSTRTYLIFGADVIATVHKDFSDERPFFLHELLHVYHEPRLGKCAEVWCAVWTEGLAVYVAKRLVPGASDAELLLVTPAPIRPAIERDRRAALCAVLAVAGTVDARATSQLIAGNAHMPGLPSRAGYVIGLYVAEELGRTRTLRQLASMTAAEARPLVLGALARLAPNCLGRSAVTRANLPPAPTRSHS